MILVLLLSRVLASVCADPPGPPVHAEVQAGLLTWAPADEQSGVTFTVQSWPFNNTTWMDVASCVRTAGTSCDVGAVLRAAKYGCVRLRVRAQRGGLSSEAVEACSREGTCTPQVNLSSVPGSLTVHLSGGHDLLDELAVKHWVCLSRLGQPRPQCWKSGSSFTISDLDQGQTYCASAQFQSHAISEGLPSCAVCREVPRARSKHAGLVLGLVLLGLALGLGSAVAYILIFHREKLKQWLKPPRSPNALTLPSEGALVLTVDEEHCLVIDRFTELNRD